MTDFEYLGFGASVAAAGFGIAYMEWCIWNINLRAEKAERAGTDASHAVETFYKSTLFGRMESAAEAAYHGAQRLASRAVNEIRYRSYIQHIRKTDGVTLLNELTAAESS